MQAGKAPWHFVCAHCGYEATTLEPSVNDTEKHLNLDEVAREEALNELRQQNFQKVIETIQSVRSDSGKDHLLDVGAAHGWFVAQASTVFASVTGIEPDLAVAENARLRGITLRLGYFPDVLSTDERFDVIVFNDVFEHIPDVSATLQACRAHLSPNGLLLLNLPVAGGFFYRTARALKSLGISAPFERMWQKGLPSPHVHYFAQNNLERLLATHAFKLKKTTTLQAIRLNGLYQRVCLMKQHNALTNRAIWLGLILVYPILALLPQDTQVFAFVKQDQ